MISLIQECYILSFGKYMKCRLPEGYTDYKDIMLYSGLVNIAVF